MFLGQGFLWQQVWNCLTAPQPQSKSPESPDSLNIDGTANHESLMDCTTRLKSTLLQLSLADLGISASQAREQPLNQQHGEAAMQHQKQIPRQAQTSPSTSNLYSDGGGFPISADLALERDTANEVSPTRALQYSCHAHENGNIETSMTSTDPDALNGMTVAFPPLPFTFQAHPPYNTMPNPTSSLPGHTRDIYKGSNICGGNGDEDFDASFDDSNNMGFGDSRQDFHNLNSFSEYRFLPTQRVSMFSSSRTRG